jgi:phosphoribosyl-AMP cyclohydrolase
VLDAAKFDDRGLVAAIVLDASTGKPLMFAFMNRESLRLTIETGKMHYWSRSRGEIWFKGGTSGHVQTVREVRIDCDGDAFVFSVEQAGGACHTGQYSCFYRRLGADGWIEDGTKVFDPERVY